MRNAAEITEVYRSEIEEGTRKRQLLLTNGAAQGKDEATVLREYGKFIPSKYTPIMNFIYFLMRDGEHPDWLGIHKHLNETLGHSKVETVQKVSEAVTEEELDQIFGMLVHEDEKYANVQEPDDMDKFIYGNMTHDMFVKMNYPYAKDVGVSAPTNCPLLLTGLTSGQAANLVVPTIKLFNPCRRIFCEAFKSLSKFLWHRGSRQAQRNRSHRQEIKNGLDFWAGFGMLLSCKHSCPYQITSSQCVVWTKADSEIRFGVKDLR